MSKLQYAVNLHQRGQFDQAAELYRQILLDQPRDFNALHLLGLIALQDGRAMEAIDLIRSAIAVDQKQAAAHYNLGNALRSLGRHEEALVCYTRSVSLEPNDPDALCNLGNEQLTLHYREAATLSFETLLKLSPDYDYALGNVFDARQHNCNWEDYAELAARIEAGVESRKRVDMPFSFLNISQQPVSQLTCAQIFCADKFPQKNVPASFGERKTHSKIRIAYLSADFHSHATVYLMMQLFELHDRQHFEINAISFGPNETSALRERLVAAFDEFIDVRTKTDDEVAMLMRELEIDIAVDLKGFTTDSRPGIFFHRGAPIQVNYLGFPGTMGADFIDYIIADHHVIPLDQQVNYAEKVVYLPDTYQVNDSGRLIMGDVPSRAEVNLPETGFVFCCFNNNYKITPDVFAIWMRLLLQIDGSVLWLLEDSDAAKENLRDEAIRCGVAVERLVFAPRTTLEKHLARHELADLFLDTLPCNAHTTASDALWTGLPLLTCMGTAFAGRVAGSLLNAVGVPELITYNLADYEALALRLVTSPPMLAEIRRRLESNRSTFPLFDTKRFRQHIELAYIQMWEIYQRGDVPTGFSVSALP